MLAHVRSSKATGQHSEKEISPQPGISCRTIWTSRAHWTHSTQPMIISQQTKGCLPLSSALTSRRCSLTVTMYVFYTTWSQTHLQEQPSSRNGTKSRVVRSHTCALYSMRGLSLPCLEGKVLRDQFENEGRGREPPLRGNCETACVVKC